MTAPTDPSSQHTPSSRSAPSSRNTPSPLPARDRATRLASTRAELRSLRREMTGTVAAVLTMGALHEGHLALVTRARELADHVILTDFVNPLQFGPDEDFEAYPRDLDADLALVDGLVDAVFAPSVAEMYPVLPPTVSVTAGRAGTVLEGAARPGHFDGVVTVVTKLLRLTDPHLSVFGRKDAQQLAIIQRLVADLELGVRIEPVEIQREPSGLARSSRNAYLDEAGRARALALSRTLRAAGAAAPSLSGVQQALREAVSRAEIDWDYALALDPATLEEAGPEHRGEVLLVLAGYVQGTRLLDAAVAVVTAP